MPAPLTRIETSTELPASADAVIIGGGIIGVFTAYYLTQRGMKVAVVEKGLVGAEQSSRNWGWCRQQNRDARELPLVTRSLDLWERFAAETGEDTGFRRCGLLYLSNDEAELAGWASWRDFARTAGVTTHMLSSAEASERGKLTNRQWRGGVYSPSDGIADPINAAPAVGRAILALGGTIHQHCAARGLETEGGKVSSVVTEKGTIRTPIAILAAGAWASSFCRQLGIRFPQAAIRQSILAVADGPEPLPDAMYTSSLSITRRGTLGHTLAISGRARVDPTPQLLRFSPQFLPMFGKRWRSLSLGGLEGVRSGHENLSRWRNDQVTPMERMRILDPAVDRATVELTRARAIELIPALKNRPVVASWSGYVDSTPDGVPGVGEIPKLPGFILAAGFSGHGFGIGPGAGHLIADIASGANPIVDPRPYHPDRFASSQKTQVADF
ncbi:FAD-binding oxidoreductase [Pseudoxanthomonas helianthi]|uniref:FAD-binding oxidoreductase n=1 Tax=Pseudoxanthomonas helianthi TaxID=1453541 RepID=A0A941AU69_9GAMM|nr:FAD-binding oxidoreductase [Pseudoxanthomonas helianthi]MBP3982893.1 FAD-binding oxidoreductase [Pseudoxanthomonas helianthi]